MDAQSNSDLWSFVAGSAPCVLCQVPLAILNQFSRLSRLAANVMELWKCHGGCACSARAFEWVVYVKWHPHKSLH